MKKIQYVGLDVDDKGFHGYVCAEGVEGGKEFVARPSIGALVRKLKDHQYADYQMKVCYEATYVGYGLQRELSKKGFECDIIAPSLIPKRQGARVKTDRLDSQKLAEYYRAGLLSRVYVPGEEEERVRGLIRSRHFFNGSIERLESACFGDVSTSRHRLSPTDLRRQPLDGAALAMVANTNQGDEFGDLENEFIFVAPSG